MQHLGLENSKKNISNKLKKKNFPSRKASIIFDDILNTLHNCNNEKEYDKKIIG